MWIIRRGKMIIFPPQTFLGVSAPLAPQNDSTAFCRCCGGPERENRGEHKYPLKFINYLYQTIKKVFDKLFLSTKPLDFKNPF